MITIRRGRQISNLNLFDDFTKFIATIGGGTIVPKNEEPKNPDSTLAKIADIIEAPIVRSKRIFSSPAVNDILHPIDTINNDIVKPVEAEFKQISDTISKDFNIALNDIESVGKEIFNVIEEVGKIIINISKFVEEIIIGIEKGFELIVDHPYLSILAIILFLHLINKI